MKKDKKGSGELPAEELVNRYYSDPKVIAGAGFPETEEFDRRKVYRNILSAIRRKQLRKQLIRKKWQVAASLGILLGLSTLVYQYGQGILSYLSPVTLKVSTTAYGEMSALILSDGTKIWLNSGSKLSYPSRFRGNAREVSLTGEAYFEVAHNSGMPFLIHTDNITTRVLGTRFNISAYEEDENITVAVVQGKVGVSANAGGAVDSMLFVIPDQRAVYSRASRSLTRQEQRDAANTTSWKEGKLLYRNAPLPEIIADIQRKYNVTILTGERIRNCAISADFNKDPLDKVLKILAELVNGKVIEQGAGYFLEGSGCQEQ